VTGELRRIQLPIMTMYYSSCNRFDDSYSQMQDKLTVEDVLFYSDIRVWIQIFSVTFSFSLLVVN